MNVIYTVRTEQLKGENFIISSTCVHSRLDQTHVKTKHLWLTSSGLAVETRAQVGRGQELLGYGGEATKDGGGAL